MIKKPVKKKIRQLKHKSVRKKLSGTAAKPRLAVFRSLKNIYAQIIDDDKAITLVSCSSIDKDVKDKIKYGGNANAAGTIGSEVAKKAMEKGIKKVVFDRGGLRYHGRIKALAEGARKQGLKF